MKPRRTQRRLPFTSWPMPGTSTSSSSRNAAPISTLEYLSHRVVGMLTATAAATSPRHTNASCRWKKWKGVPVSRSDTPIEAEATITRPTSSSAATGPITHGSIASRRGRPEERA